MMNCQQLNRFFQQSYAFSSLTPKPSLVVADASPLEPQQQQQQDCLMDLDYDLADSYQSNQNSSKIELWQFLLELLEDPRQRYKNIIRWLTPPSLSIVASSTTSLQQPSPPLHPVQTQRSISSCSSSSGGGFHDNDFVILDPNEVARRWSLRRCSHNKPFVLLASSSSSSSQNKIFCRILRSYYTKKSILHKVAGKSNTFSFQINIQPYLNQLLRNNNNQQTCMMSIHGTGY